MVERKERRRRSQRQQNNVSKTAPVRSDVADGHLLSDGLLKYLEELHELFLGELARREQRQDTYHFQKVERQESGKEDKRKDEDDIELLKARFLREIRGFEISAFVDARISRIWESIISHFSAADISTLLCRKSLRSFENLLLIIKNKIGSYVFERLLIRSISHFHSFSEHSSPESKEEQNDQSIVKLEEFWRHFSTDVCIESKNLLNLMQHPSASHVLRSFILSCSGFIENGFIISEDKIVREEAKPLLSKRSLMECLKVFWSVVEQQANEFITEKVINDPNGCLVLEALLLSTSVFEMEASHLIRKVSQFIEQPDRKDLFCKLACHPVASHFLEAFVFSLQGNDFQRMYDSHAKSSIPHLLYDRYGNHVLQRIFRKQRYGPKVLDVLDHLEPEINKLMPSLQWGIVLSVGDSCLVTDVKTQKRFVRLVANALDCSGEMSIHLVRKLLFPSSFMQNQFSDVVKRVSSQMNHKDFHLSESVIIGFPDCFILGSLLIQTFMKYAETASNLLKSPFLTSVRSGSRSVESFIMNCRNVSLMSRLTDRLSGLFPLMTRDPNGFHIVSCIFRVTDIKRKRKIVEELASQRLSLSTSLYGRKALNRFKVYEFVRREEQWNQSEMTKRPERDCLMIF
eukprot:jgi/Galph1/955/GphlegSOOS_G5679.1